MLFQMLAVLLGGSRGRQTLVPFGWLSILGFWRRGSSEILSVRWVTTNLKTPSSRCLGPFKTAALGVLSGKRGRT